MVTNFFSFMIDFNSSILFNEFDNGFSTNNGIPDLANLITDPICLTVSFVTNAKSGFSRIHCVRESNVLQCFFQVHY